MGTIQPVGDRVLVRPDAPESASKSGLVLSTINEEKQYRGTVVAVGDGKEVERFKVGAILIYQKYGPAEVTVNGEKMYIVHLDEILGREHE